MTAIFEITDGTTTVDLISPATGFHLIEWRQNIIGLKNDGVVQDSSLGEGSQLVFGQFGNGLETLTLKANDISQNTLIRDTQNLLRLLEKARNYWMGNGYNETVYLKVKSSQETNTRYAVLINYHLTELPNPFNQPFLNPGCNAVYDDFDVVLERQHWTALAPGSDECVQLSSTQHVVKTQTFEPSITADTATEFYGNISTTTPLWLGAWFNTGLRFRSITIPAGAIIVSAKIRIISDATDIDEARLIIKGEKTTTPASFTTSANYWNRDRTEAFTFWTTPEFDAIDTYYDTSNIAPIIQEIIDLDTWVSGRNIVFFIEDVDNITSLQKQIKGRDDGTPTHQLVVTYRTGTEYGRATTCNNEVYVTNGFNTANLTHIFHYDDGTSTFSSNLLNAELPYDLFPDPLGVDDILYLGISDDNDNPQGAFRSIVFDLEPFDSASWVEFVQTRMWTGSWAEPGYLQNNTASSLTYLFRESGVNSIHFQPHTLWTTTTVNGVSGYWARYSVDTIHNAPATIAQQQNRPPYTVLNSWVDISYDQVLGDIKCIGRGKIQNQSGDNVFVTSSSSNRLIIGSRTLLTDDKFTPYLNCTNTQNPPGITVVAGDDTVLGTANTQTANGEEAVFTSTDTNNATRITWTIDETVTQSYYGNFRVFLRAHHVTIPGPSVPYSKANIRISTGSGGVQFTGEQVSFLTDNAWELLDLGTIRIPASTIFLSTEKPDSVTLELQLQGSTPVPYVIDCYDLVLMPITEWSIDIIDKANVENSILGHGQYLEIDSTQQQRTTPVRSLVKNVLSDNISSIYQSLTNGRFGLQANKNQRLYFLSARYGDDDEWTSEPWISHSVQLYKNERYLSGRGDR